MNQLFLHRSILFPLFQLQSTPIVVYIRAFLSVEELRTDSFPVMGFGVSLLSLRTREDENFYIGLTFSTSLVVDAAIFLMRLEPSHNRKLSTELLLVSMFSTTQLFQFFMFLPQAAIAP